MTIEVDKAGELLLERLLAATRAGTPTAAVVAGLDFPIEVTGVKRTNDGVVQLTTTNGVWNVRQTHLIAIKVAE